MKSVIWKAYWNYEKEENWLNQMAAKGMGLIDYWWCRYVFEECPKGEYIYRIELLEHSPSHPESAAYIKFMEETGIECIATYMRWAYFRKKAADGPFEIYSDIESKIAHFKRINILWIVLAGVEFFGGFINIAAVIGNYVSQNSIYTANIIFSILLLAIGVSCVLLGAKVRKKIRRLKREKAIRE
jgi:hypothetical protein